MAKANLDEILEALSPEEIGNKVRKKHQRAILSYGLKEIEVPDYESFRSHIIKYVQHHSKTASGVPLTEERAFALGQKILSQGRGGFKGAFDSAKEGRLADVLKSIADAMEEEHVNDYTMHHLGKIDPFDWQEHREIAGKLIGMYKPLLKGGAKSPEEAAHEYQQLVGAHGQLVHQVKGVYGKYERGKKEKHPYHEMRKAA